MSQETRLDPTRNLDPNQIQKYRQKIIFTILTIILSNIFLKNVYIFMILYFVLIFFVYKLSVEIKSNMPEIIYRIITMLIPILNLSTLYFLNKSASKILKENNIVTNFFGSITSTKQ